MIITEKEENILKILKLLFSKDKENFELSFELAKSINFDIFENPLVQIYFQFNQTILISSDFDKDSLEWLLNRFFHKHCEKDEINVYRDEHETLQKIISWIIYNFLYGGLPKIIKFNHNPDWYNKLNYFKNLEYLLNYFKIFLENNYTFSVPTSTSYLQFLKIVYNLK